MNGRLKKLKLYSSSKDHNQKHISAKQFPVLTTTKK